MVIAAATVTASNDYYAARPCAQLAHIARNQSATLELYPECEAFFNGTDLGKNALVHASMGSGRPSEIAGAFGISFGMAIWVSLWLHAIGVEFYVSSSTDSQASDPNLILPSCTLYHTKKQMA